MGLYGNHFAPPPRSLPGGGKYNCMVLTKTLFSFVHTNKNTGDFAESLARGQNFCYNKNSVLYNKFLEEYAMKITKCLAASAALTMTCTVLFLYAAPGAAITAGAEAYEQLTYEVQNDGTIAITGCAEDAVSVEIPEEIGGKKVTGIGEKAFYRCSGLTDVAIPDSVTYIGNSAFCGCTGLTDIAIPDGVTSIGEDAFGFCEGLTSVTIPDSVTSIGTWAFESCSGLTDITILNPNCAIGDNMYTISSYAVYVDDKGFVVFYTGTISGYDGSTAQAYAEKYERTFVSLGKAPVREHKCGDIDGDGDLNAADASLLLAAAALTGTGQPSGLTPEQEAAADVDGKNGFNAVDASYILQYAAYMGNNPGADLDIKSFIAGR